MKSEELLSMIAEDSELNNNKLDMESLRIPSLHAKYYRIFLDEFRALKGMQIELAVLKKAKTEYYLGRAPDEEYVAKPLHVKILKQDLETYLLADVDITTLDSRVQMQKAKTDMVEKFMSSLNQRGYNIKSAIDFMKFKAGEY